MRKTIQPCEGREFCGKDCIGCQLMIPFEAEVCDYCGKMPEDDRLYEFNGLDLCEDCLLEKIPCHSVNV